MIRMIQSQSLHHAKSYFSQSLRQSDYYLNGQELPGRFNGRIVARLGLDDAIHRKTFHALCENKHPLTKQKLTQRNHPNRRVGYDINFHCPKSVSALHVLSKDTHIMDAFRESVTETMLDIERQVQTRVRKGKQKNTTENRSTGELLWAEFVHQTARPVDSIEPDPHLHCHCFTFNVTWDDVEQCYKAGEFGDIKRDMPFYQAAFHKRLSDKLMGLGYRIRRTDMAFEVEGVPQAVIDLFSKRTGEIGQLADKLGMTDAKELDKLGSRTRSKKQKGLSMDELKSAWRKQIYDLGMDKQGEGKAIIRYGERQANQSLKAADCIAHALKQRFERASVCDGRGILETAFRHAMGDVSVNLEAITGAFEHDNHIIRVTDRGRETCSTQTVLAEEQRMVKLARDGRGVMLPLYHTTPDMTLDGGQSAAVKHLLTTTDQVSIIQGRAGTGKTTLMKEAVKLIEQAGSKVMVVAPTSDASRGVLRAEGFTDAETVALLLSSPVLQGKLKNNVLWVDEAGLLGTGDMAALLALVKEQNARLILSGDTRQHGSVVRGDALRILHTVAGIKSAGVSKIYRQRNHHYKQAVQALADSDMKTGIMRLQEMGAIKEIDPLQPVVTLVEDYVATIKRSKTALVVSPTHKQGDEVTVAIRKRLRELGRIGQQEVAVTRLVNLNFTEAQREDWRNYKPMQVIQFNQNAIGFKRGSKWSVQEITASDISLRDECGNLARLPLHQADRFDVFVKKTFGLSSGDSLRITRNGADISGKRLNNGQKLEMTGIDENGHIQARSPDNGAIYTLPQNYGHIAHAYCMTSHASQGKTVDEVFIYQPAATFAATNQKQFYVSVSRGRDAVHLYTDDTKELLNAASRMGDRLSAMELLVKRKNNNQERAEQLIRKNLAVPQEHKAASQIGPQHKARTHEPSPV